VNGTEGEKGRRGKRGRTGGRGLKGEPGEQGVQGPPGQLLANDTGRFTHLHQSLSCCHFVTLSLCHPLYTYIHTHVYDSVLRVNST